MVACLLALALAACSLVRVAYNQADDLLYWWVDGYLDLGETQSLRLREDIARAFAWHRRQELPAYADLLARVRQQATAPVTADAVCAVFDEVRERAVRIGERFEPGVLALAQSVNAAQIRHLERKLAERNEKWRDEWMDAPEKKRLARRIERAQERAERIYGRLHEPQLAVLRAQVAASPFDAALSYRETVARQQDLVQALRQIAAGSAGAEQARPIMRGVFDRALQSPDAVYRAYFERLTRHGCEATAALHNSIDAKQREHARQALKSYEDDLRALAAPR